MTKRERLEDIGVLLNKLDALLEDDMFENTGSKHCFETWVAKTFPSKKLEELNEEVDSLGDELYDYHMKIRYLKTRIEEIWAIARGDDE